MNKQELKSILQQGEGLKAEFKESLSGIDKEIVSFANAEGGRVFLGVNDSGKVKGVKTTNKLKSQIQDIVNNCDPPIKINIEEFGGIIIINVDEGDDKSYKCSAGFFSRVGPNSQKLKRDEIIKLITETGKIKFDEQINKKFRFPQDFNEKWFLEFLKRSGISKITQTRKILTNLSLGNVIGRKFVLNNAGVLLFAKEPKKFLRQNFVTCVLYKGKEKVDIIDRKDFSNNLFNNYEDTFAFLKQHLRLEYEIKGYGPRKEIPEIPYESLKEAIINALVHRDYFDNRFGVFVEIFDDRVEITNKGKLLFDKRQLGKVSMPRNPIIFDMFYRINLIEKAGSGINRIRKQIKERGLKIRFETDEFFRIVFFRPQIEWSGKITEKVTEKVTENQKKILNSILKDSLITAKMLSKIVGISERKIKENIAKLKQKHLLRRVGPARGGYWKIIKK